MMEDDDDVTGSDVEVSKIHYSGMCLNCRPEFVTLAARDLESF